ncbi:hypothetical protein [Fulvivirga sedimenti]|nr:hypothetical protein [Fulvivirga sedimenti]
MHEADLVRQENSLTETAEYVLPGYPGIPGPMCKPWNVRDSPALLV